MLHAVHIHIHTPMARLINKWQTPYKMLQGKKPDVSHIHILDCGAYVFIPPDRCTAGPGALSFYNFFLKPFLTSPASICLNLPQVEAT